MAMSHQATQQIDKQIDRTVMVGVLDMADVLERVAD
jgi:hypothetical protein